MRPADVIVINADIRSMDPHQPRVRALAIVQGRVRALGSDADIRPLPGRARR